MTFWHSSRGLPAGLFGGDDKEFDLAESELVVGVVEAYRKDLLDGIKDGLRDEGGAVGSLLRCDDGTSCRESWHRTVPGGVDPRWTWFES